jgi:hypothetical protein
MRAAGRDESAIPGRQLFAFAGHTERHRRRSSERQRGEVLFLPCSSGSVVMIPVAVAVAVVVALVHAQRAGVVYDLAADHRQD